MMKINKSIPRLYLFILIIMMRVGLFPGSAAAAETLRIGINEFPAALNPVYTSTETSQAIINKVFNGLFYFDEHGNIQKELVEKVHFESTVKIIIELKKNIFFSDGKELTADDVVATVGLLQDRRFKYPYVSNLKFIKSLEKIDRYRFKITMPYRFAPWRAYLTFKILNSHEIIDAPPDTFRDTILSGSGPYQFKTIKRPTRIILERNPANPIHPIPGHLAEIPGKMFQLIEYNVISYTHLAPLKLINNEIDICELQPENAAAYQQTKSKEWHQSFSLLKYRKFGYTYLVFNLRNSLITKNLRALFYNLLINGDFLARFLKGRGERLASPFLLLNSKAKPLQLETTPLENPVRLNILTNSESKLRKQLVLFLREALKSFNIYLQPVFLEYHTFLEYLKKGRYDIGVSAFILDIDYDMTDIFASDSYLNYAHFRSPEMDALLQQGLRELNPGEREAIYLKAHRVWLENLPLIPLFNLYYYVGVSRHIEIPARRMEVVGSVGDFLYNILEWRKR